jgi:hypothetical protein
MESNKELPDILSEFLTLESDFVCQSTIHTGTLSDSFEVENEFNNFEAFVNCQENTTSPNQEYFLENWSENQTKIYENLNNRQEYLEQKSNHSSGRKSTVSVQSEREKNSTTCVFSGGVQTDEDFYQPQTESSSQFGQTEGFPAELNILDIDTSSYSDINRNVNEYYINLYPDSNQEQLLRSPGNISAGTNCDLLSSFQINNNDNFPQLMSPSSSEFSCSFGSTSRVQTPKLQPRETTTTDSVSVARKIPVLPATSSSTAATTTTRSATTATYTATALVRVPTTATTTTTENSKSSSATNIGHKITDNLNARQQRMREELKQFASEVVAKQKREREEKQRAEQLQHNKEHSYKINMAGPSSASKKGTKRPCSMEFPRMHPQSSTKISRNDLKDMSAVDISLCDFDPDLSFIDIARRCQKPKRGPEPKWDTFISIKDFNNKKKDGSIKKDVKAEDERFKRQRMTLQSTVIDIQEEGLAQIQEQHKESPEQAFRMAYQLLVNTTGKYLDFQCGKDLVSSAAQTHSNTE